MHELAIAEAIVAIADRHARGRPVARVEVAVGRSQVGEVVGWDGWYEQVVEGPGDDEYAGRIENH